MCSTDVLYRLHFKKLNLVFIAPEQSRAQSATELLQELNNDVSGNFVEEVWFFFFSPSICRFILLLNVSVMAVK